MTTKPDIRELLVRAWYEGEVRQYEAWWREKFGDDEDDDPYPSWGRVQPHGKERMLAKVDAQLAALKEAGLAVVPVEMTDEMIAAATRNRAWQTMARAFWSAMLAAGRLDT